MAVINSSIGRALPVIPRPVAPKNDPVTEERETERSRAATPRKSGVLQMLDMQDDLSGLVSSMRRARDRSTGTDDIRSQPWLEHVLDEQGPRKLESIRQTLNHLQSPDLATLRGLLQEAFADPSDLLAAVRVLLAEAELETLRRLLAELHEQLAGEEGARAARGGVNVALKARLQAGRLRATPRQLRRSYQDFLAGDDPLESYQRWIDLYGFERRGGVVDFIEQALAADMYALDPSCSRLEFGTLLQSARQLTTLRSADFLLQLHCWHAPLMKRLGVEQPQLLAALLRMVRLGGGLGELFQGVLSASTVVLSLDERALFTQRIRRFLRAVPHGLWPSIGLQAQALDEVDGVLDAVISRLQHDGAPMRRVSA